MMKQIALLLGLFAQPSFAQGTYPSGKAIDCYCTNTQGIRIELGQTICMHVGDRMFMAQCQMSLNVPMWREVGQGCLSSSLRGHADQGQNILQSFLVHTHI